MTCAIILAAGRSRRMGTQKLLLPFGGTTVIAHVVGQVLASGVEEGYVVVGCDGRQIADELSGRRVTIVTNPDQDSSMLDSVRCGLRALPQGCESILVALGDQPGITSELVDDMLRAFAATDRAILVPVHEGRRGHPLLFSAGYCEDVLTRYDEVGLRGLLRAHPDEVLELPASSSAVLSDMDYPGDYREELARHEANGAGRHAEED